MYLKNARHVVFSYFRSHIYIDAFRAKLNVNLKLTADRSNLDYAAESF